MANDQINKIACFEYLVWKFSDWHRQIRPNEQPYQSLSKLKIFKLHFFASAVNADENSEGLLDIFDNFHALPYGPVESEIYDRLSETNVYTIGNSYIQEKNSYSTLFETVDAQRNELDNAVSSLRKRNNDLVTYNAMQLVELSHKWYSWRVNFDIARSMNKFSRQIPKDMIKNEIKFFSI